MSAAQSPRRAEWPARTPKPAVGDDHFGPTPVALARFDVHAHAGSYERYPLGFVCRADVRVTSLADRDAAQRWPKYSPRILVTSTELAKRSASRLFVKPLLGLPPIMRAVAHPPALARLGAL